MCVDVPARGLDDPLLQRDLLGKAIHPTIGQAGSRAAVMRTILEACPDRIDRGPNALPSRHVVPDPTSTPPPLGIEYYTVRRLADRHRPSGTSW